MKRKASLLAVAILAAGRVTGQETADSVFHRHFVGTSAFMLGNLFPDPPSFYQLNAGYWLSRKDVLSAEAITWKYDAPLGIPYGASFGDPATRFPGAVRGFGLGAAWQHYWWKGIYSSVHATPFRQHYLDTNGQRIGEGFQLFLAFRIGYHIRLLGDRLFIEPSVACTYWPVQTNLPAGFAEKEKGWPNYFLPEPGLHLGLKF